MNDEAKKYLAELLAKSPVELTEEQMAFLKARRSYLTEEQLINFGLVETQDGEDEQSKYADLSVKELKAEVMSRGLEAPDKAKKPDLIAILEENDSTSETARES